MQIRKKGSWILVSAQAAVLGAGAAGWNAASVLAGGGLDTVLLADDLTGGASQNAGSDKQTFYKLSVAGRDADSVSAMAESLYACGGIEGTHAQILASESARAFYHLVEAGVPFPCNEYGEFVGYRTDHDTTLRATSAGPLTSRYMAQRLRREAEQRNVRTVDGTELVSFLKGRNGKLSGMLLYAGKEENLSQEEILLAREELGNPENFVQGWQEETCPDTLDLRTWRGWILVNAPSVVICTGGPAAIYGKTVYPPSQYGATGTALRFGAKASNLCFWQYGMASVDVRWNVSGSYQQALPAYVDENGESVLDSIEEEHRMDAIFLKGYQWPFDERKTDGSSRVDLCVHAAISQGRKVYLDYRREEIVKPLIGLCAEGRDYLRNCGAEMEKPVNRLRAINEEAYQFYRERGIDLQYEPLRIAICAQHCNGGLSVDENWETDVENLFACGECAGIYGPYRPGGSALLETQVGSRRAAEKILRRHPAGQKENAFLQETIPDLAAVLGGIRAAGPADGIVLSGLRENMDLEAGAVRSVKDMETMERSVRMILAQKQLPYRFRDTLLTMWFTLSSMLLQAEDGGKAGHRTVPQQDTGSAENLRYITRWNGEEPVTYRKTADPLPDGGGWFERVWSEYRARMEK
ncbi:MAG: FAD-binding protein [Clostridia bacterium]|nr:FAD-binding protein [Clostridia bacterium]